MAARKTRKLTDAQARAIYRSDWSYTQLAEHYKVSHPTIADIKRHRSYRHIHENTSGQSEPKTSGGAPAPITTTRPEVTESGAVSHLSAASDGRGCGHGGASLTSPAGTPKPAGASSDGTCSACGAASATDLCDSCQTVATRLPGFGEGPLPHYGMTGPIERWRQEVARRNVSRNKSLKSRQGKCAVKERV
jgi:hypothetical protein